MKMLKRHIYLGFELIGFGFMSDKIQKFPEKKQVALKQTRLRSH
jgi:hypothetical protein